MHGGPCLRQHRVMTRFVLPGLLACVFLAACADTGTVVETISPGTFSGRHARSVYVPRLVANSQWASEVSREFEEELSARTAGKVTVVPGEPAVSAPPDTPTRIASGEAAFAGVVDVASSGGDTALAAARHAGAGLLAMGDVSTHAVKDGFVAEATVQITSVVDGTVMCRLRKSVTGPDERKAAVAAAKLAAEAVAVGF